MNALFNEIRTLPCIADGYKCCMHELSIMVFEDITHESAYVYSERQIFRITPGGDSYVYVVVNTGYDTAYATIVNTSSICDLVNREIATHKTGGINQV